MQTTITAKTLQEKLTALTRITESKATAKGDILSHVMLTCATAGSTIWATNLTETLRQPIEAKVTEEGSVCVPGKKLLEICKELEGDVTIKTTQGGIAVTSGKSRFTISCMPAEQYPAWPELGDTKPLIIGAATFKGLIEQTIFATADNGTQSFSQSVLMHLMPDKKELRLVATDGHRLATDSTPLQQAPEAETKLLVPKKAASEIARLLEGEQPVTISWNKNYIGVTKGDVVFLSRLREGSYPQYEQVIPKDSDIEIAMPREALESALKRIRIISREDGNGVALNITKGSMEMTSTAKEVGDASEEMPVNYDGEPIRSVFNAEYLLSALTQVKGTEVTVRLSTKPAPALVTIDDKAWRYVIMPIRK